MTRLLALRHGPTAWTREHRIQGHTDTPLSAEGREAVAGWSLPPPFDGEVPAFVSPLRRAQETAALLGLAQAQVEPALIERSWGDWEGLRLADLKRRFGAETADPDRAGLDARPPGGESPREQMVRLAPFLAARAEAGGDAVLVTHKGVLRALYALASGWTMTAPSPIKLRDGCGQLFALDRAGRLTLAEPNLNLAAEAA